MRIALVGPELEENLALRYLHAAVDRAGHGAEIFDFHAPDQIPDLIAGLMAAGPEVVGLSMVFTARAGEFIALAEGLRAAGYRGHITAGGHFASFHARQILEDYSAFNSIIHGEGEEAIVDLIEHLDRPERVPGLTWRDAAGRIHGTGRRANIDDLDLRPWPTRPASFQDYFGLPIASILSSRGCYGNCHFCSINAWHRQNGGKRFRQRDVRCVAGEMAQLVHDRGVRIFNFHDDNFFLPQKQANLARLGALKQRLDDLGVGRIAVQVKARPDNFDPDVIALLKEIGLFRVFLGVETNAVAGLKTLGRGTERRQNDRALRVLRRFGLHTCFNLLMFDPDARLGDLWENIRFMRRQARFPLNFCRVEVYSGTEIERRLQRENRLLGNYLGYHYRIAEEPVQLAYEIFRDVFWARNHEITGMNHQAMAIDYEFHLLRHFYPRRADGGLEKAVKNLILRLNHNNAELLGRICRFVESPRLPSAERTERLIAELGARREAFDGAMGRQVHEVRSRIWELGTSPAPVRSGVVSTAASVAAAAGVCSTALALGGPAGEASAAPQPAAPTPPAILTPPCEIIPWPFRPGAELPEGLEGLVESLEPHPADYVKLREVIDQKYYAVARREAELLQLADKSVTLGLFVSQEGKASLTPWIPDGGKHAEFSQRLEQSVKSWQFPHLKRDAVCRFTLNFALRGLSPEETAGVKSFADRQCELQVQKNAERKWLAGTVAAVYLELDKVGKVAECQIHTTPGQKDALKRRKQLLGILRGLQFPGITKPGSCTILLEVKPLGAPKPATEEPPKWHMFEMAPGPLQPPHDKAQQR